MSVFIDSKYLGLMSVRLRNFKRKGPSLWNFSCPLCGDSKKDLTKARGYMYAKKADLLYKCHNCGASMIFANFLKAIDNTMYEEYMVERFTNGDIGRNIKTPDRSNDFKTTPPKVTAPRKLLSCDSLTELDVDHPAIRYVLSRQIPKSQWARLYYTSDFVKFSLQFTDRYKDLKIENDARLVMPFYNRNDELTHVQGRSLTATAGDRLRYLTLEVDGNEDIKLFGAERVKISQRIYAVEGPIDSLFLPNAVATADSNLLAAVDALPEAKDIVLVFDNEPRNKDLIRTIRKAVANKYQVCLWPETMKWKDINDMIVKGGLTSEQVRGIIDENTYSGLTLELVFSNWVKNCEESHAVSRNA